MKAVIIPVVGDIYEAELPGYEELSAAVGGYIEVINFGEGHVAWLNEEGKLSNPPLPPNWRATDLCFDRQVGLRYGDYIAGNLVVCGGCDDDGENTDIDPKLAKDLLALNQS